MILDGTQHRFTSGLSDRPVENTDLKGYVCPACECVDTHVDTYTYKIVCNICGFTDYDGIFSFAKDRKKEIL